MSQVSGECRPSLSAIHAGIVRAYEALIDGEVDFALVVLDDLVGELLISGVSGGARGDPPLRGEWASRGG